MLVVTQLTFVRQKNRMAEDNDIFYIERVLKGDKGAYSYLVNRYSGMVYSMALRLLKNDVEAEDLSQEVFVSAFRSLAGFKRSAKFSTWIYRITYNKAISQLRKKCSTLSTDNEVFLETLAGVDHSEEILIQEEDKEKLLGEAIKQLPEGDQILIMLHYYENQSMEDISTITGISVSNVKVKLFRIRKRLKEMLVQSGYETSHEQMLTHAYH
jgi:RNA polymerase sigma-70 factor (ECF subfamily)